MNKVPISTIFSSLGQNPIVLNPSPSLIINIYKILIIKMNFWKITFVHRRSYTIYSIS